MQDFAEDIQVGLEGVEELDDNDTGFQVRSLLFPLHIGAAVRPTE